MNLSRLLLLLSLIASALLLAMNQLAPPIFERQTRDVLFSRLDAEIRFLEQRERTAALQREVVATQIADSPQLRRLLESEQPSSRVVIDGFSGLAQAALDRGRISLHTATLIGPSGQILTPTPQRGVLTTEELVAGAHAPLALERRTPVHHVFAITGRLFQSVSVPVPGAVGDVLGAVVLIQEVTGAAVAERRTGASTDLAYFAQLEIIADTLPGGMMRERALALVRRTNAGNIGRGGRIQLAEFERFSPPVVDGSSFRQSDRMELMAPIALPVSNVEQTTSAEYGAVVIVEAEWPSSSLLAFFINGHAFDEGTMVLWSFLAAALGLFFLGIILDDVVRARLMNRIAEAVEVIAQSNHPQPISESSYPSIYRPMVRAVNALTEEYKSRAAAARRAREEADEAHRRVDQITGSLPDVSDLIVGDDNPAVGQRPLPGGFSPALSEAPEPTEASAAPSAPMTPTGPDELEDHARRSRRDAELASASTHAMPAILDMVIEQNHAQPTRQQTPPPENATMRMDGVMPSAASLNRTADDDIDPSEFDFVSNSINKVAAAFLNETAADEDSGLTDLARESEAATPTAQAEGHTAGGRTARFFARLDADEPVPTDFADVQPLSMETVVSGLSTAVEEGQPTEPSSTTDSPMASRESASEDASSSSAPAQTEALEEMTPDPPETATSAPAAASDTSTTETSALHEAEDLIARAEAKLARLSSTADEDSLLFDEFTRARAECGESTSDLSLAKFTRRLERSREQLKERYNAENVEFSVAIVEGKATLKARPVRD